MINRSEVRDLLSDYVILLERQVENFDRKTVMDVVEFICSSNKKNESDFPRLFLGEDMKTVYFQFSEGKTEMFTKDNFRIFLDYINILKGKIETKEQGGS